MAQIEYVCKLCGWKGTKIKEQIAQIDTSVIPTLTRYCCWKCGLEVFPLISGTDLRGTSLPS